ncbi:hypothetical protein EGR_04537 [Echinococcus granulosus]|uniref:Uncharacterized protein n=1 Tax=Echinococcus granulosus TaxID=6210 RepID=W6V3S3_ECHGR|nr:hypothetical protein EGR_04537 [Echinococcus granulosus]EUB60704.1 hypothetical protein EGR_04537 [Echinococcus granulosus]
MSPLAINRIHSMAVPQSPSGVNFQLVYLVAAISQPIPNINNEAYDALAIRPCSEEPLRSST